MADLWMDVDAALAEVPVNVLPLVDSGDFVTVEDAVTYDQAGMDLRWNFVTTAGAYTSTAVTPTSGGNYDWANQGDGMYSIEIPASGGASINNDTEGFGWFSGKITGVLPFRGPVIGFRAAGLNDLLIDSAFSTTRGLAGTALPDEAAEAAGGLYTRGTGAGQINQAANGQSDVNVVKVNNTAVTGVGLAAGIIGNATLDGTTYRMSAWLIVNGAVIAGASLSNEDVVWYDKEGDTDLNWSATPAVASTGCISGAGTLDDPGDNKPISVKVSVDYGGNTYSGIIPVSRPA